MAKYEDVVLVEMALTKLESNTKLFFGSRDLAAKAVDVKSVKFVPSEELGLLTVYTEVSSNGNNYKTKVQFKDVEFPEEKSTDTVLAKSSSGDILLTKIDKDSEVAVSCSCLDFYYRFATWLSKEDALVGNPPPPYVKKTNRPEVNPEKIPAMCKHLIATMKELRRRDIVK